MQIFKKLIGPSLFYSIFKLLLTIPVFAEPLMIDDGTGVDLEPPSTEVVDAIPWEFNSAGDLVSTKSANGEVTQIEVPGAADEYAANKRPPPDLHLKPGFPVSVMTKSAGYFPGPGLHTLVGNIDADPEPEIIVPGFGTGLIYAFNFDGSLVSGWPVSAPNNSAGVGYPGLGFISQPTPCINDDACARRRVVYDVLAGFSRSNSPLVAWSGSGSILPDWINRRSFGAIRTAPSMANILAGDGAAIFFTPGDTGLHGYDVTGQPLPGFPIYEYLMGSKNCIPAIGDVDGDNRPEIITVGGHSGGVWLFAYHSDGTSLNAFPLQVSNYEGWQTYPVIGDVNGDGLNEIVLIEREEARPFRPKLMIFSGQGNLLASRLLASTSGSTYAPALADLNRDGFPEIIIENESAVEVFYGNGEPYPGFPAFFPPRWVGNSGPVVGDVDGDQKPEIVITTQAPGSGSNGELRIFNDDGSTLVVKSLQIGSGAVPAITDIDLDGRNDVIVTGTIWDGTIGVKPKVWAFDFGYRRSGKIEWGQLGGNPQHTGLYNPRPHSWRYPH